MKTKQELYDFMDQYKLMVISSVNKDGLPNGAIVGFGQTENLEIVFGTDNGSRKYQNISANPRVAITLGGETPETIQYEGNCRELAPDEIEIIRDSYWRKSPFAEKFHNNPGQRYFIVTPTWLRYTDLRSDPWDITELKF